MEHFKNVSLEDASKKSNEILTNYKKSLDEQFEKHKLEYTASSKALEEAKINAVKLEAKRALAKAQAELKREVSKHHKEIKSYVFSEVNKKLDEFKKTSDYQSMIVSQINSVMKEFDGDFIQFLIDKSDEELLDKLKKETGANIEIATGSFVGGTKAIIESRNILVDNSFKTKLSEEEENFTISL